MTRRTLRHLGTIVNGAPRHHHTVCTAGCGCRTADTVEAVATGRPCPRCAAPVQPAATQEACA